MTEENYNYRTNPLFLRNQFIGDDKFNIPTIPKSKFVDKDFENLLLIGFDRINNKDYKNFNRMVHFFLYDYKFEKVWKNPGNEIKKLINYSATFSPDFSMYLDMALAMQLYNTFRNRWCGAYFSSKGVRVVPTVSWGNENTFDFCFKGIPKGGTVAVSTYMVSEREGQQDQKEFFLKGYNEMLRQLEPERIICYNHPFPEMSGNIIFVDYELSSWKYQNNNHTSSTYSSYILGGNVIPRDSNIIIKSGFVIQENANIKGMGSSSGGQWKPKSDDDKQLVGEPNTTNTKGYKVTNIGKNGKADYQQHNTDHSNPNFHSNPHGHNISWDDNTGYPIFGPPINSWEISKNFIIKEKTNMEWTAEYLHSIAKRNNFEEYAFKSISDFKWCLQYGGEVQFEYNDEFYGICKSDNYFCLYEANKPNSVLKFSFIDDLLNSKIQNQQLREIITKVNVFDRTI